MRSEAAYVAAECHATGRHPADGLGHRAQQWLWSSAKAALPGAWFARRRFAERHRRRRATRGTPREVLRAGLVSRTERKEPFAEQKNIPTTIPITSSTYDALSLSPGMPKKALSLSPGVRVYMRVIHCVSMHDHICSLSCYAWMMNGIDIAS